MRRTLTSALILFFGVALAQAQKPYVTIDFPGVNHTELTAISPSGDIVGRYVDGNNVQHGFLYRGDRFTSIDYPGAAFTDVTYINPRGEIVGFYVDFNFMAHGFVLSKGKFSSLDFPGAMSTISYGISTSGIVIGPYWDSNFRAHSWAWSGTGYSALPDFPGASETYATMIAGKLIVGFIVNLNNDGNFHGFVLKGGSFSAVDYPGAMQSLISGLNPVGEMVGGYSLTGSDEHGFLYTGDKYIKIQFPEWASSYANGIDPQGDIVGRYTDGQGVFHGFFLPQSYRPKQ